MKAADVMTPKPLTVREDCSIAEAAQLMLEKRISGLPVVDTNDELVGVVTEGDFLRRAETGTEKKRPRWLELVLGPGHLADDYVRTHGRKVGEVMTPDVISVSPEADLTAVVSLMEQHRIKRIPVVVKRKVVGIVSRANLLQVLLTTSAAAEPVAGDDAVIRDRIYAALDKQLWAPRASVNVMVRKGVVNLSGVIFDERERQALRVVVENVAGVKGVVDNVAWVEPMSGWVMDAPKEEQRAS